MCFSIPKKILTCEGNKAIIEGDISVDISHIPNCTVGDFIIVTSGVAITKVEQDEAHAMRSTIKQTHEELQ